MNEDSDLALAEEILRLLSLTKIFSNSFGIRRARVRNWRLMGIVMELEKAGQVNPRLLRAAITDLIPGGQSTHALHQTQYTYVEEFHNPDGGFLTPVFKTPAAARPKNARPQTRQRKPNISHYELNPHFRSCEYKYVSGFLDLRRSELGLDGLELLKEDPRVTRLFKSLLVFQRVHYLPLWLNLLADFNRVCGERQYDPTKFNEWAPRDPTWVILLSTWHHALQNPKKWLRGGDFNTNAVGWLVFPTGDSVADCVEALSHQKGCRFLLRRKGGFELEYLLNEEYEEALRRYSRPLRAIRETMKSQILAALS